MIRLKTMFVYNWIELDYLYAWFSFFTHKPWDSMYGWLFTIFFTHSICGIMIRDCSNSCLFLQSVFLYFELMYYERITENL